MNNNKLFDLRFVIGLFFSIVGIMLLIYSFSYTGPDARAEGINRWSGAVFLVFGVGMIILSLKKDADDELLKK